MTMKLNVVILAAGQGKRMHSTVPKVLHRLGGKPLLEHVIQAAENLRPHKIFVVYGHGGKQVQDFFKGREIAWVEQKELRGTGHAVQQVLPFLEKKQRVLILLGDAPLLSSQMLSGLIQETPASEIALVTSFLQNPTGFGRIIRNAQGKISAIIEEKDATEQQKAIREINTGICLFPSNELTCWLPKLTNHNKQKEYYLTDLFAMAVRENCSVHTVSTQFDGEAFGVNDHLQLAFLERVYQRRQVERWMLEGLTVLDPSRVDVRGEFRFGQDVVIDINVMMEGTVQVGANCYIGPNVILRNVTLGDYVRIEANSVIDGAEIHDFCVVGPFARIRPDTLLQRNAKVGNFVEVKKSKIGEHSKVNHLTYLGDTQVGNQVNVGAGTITCNYDGVNKYPTVIEDEAFIGSNTALVAPVTIERGATIGAGSTITSTAPAHRLTLARARQVTIENWKSPQKKESNHE